MAKKINLAPRDKPKKNKEDKYKETSSIKMNYKHKPKDNLIYLGLLEEYKGKPCTIIKRSHRKNIEYYKVKFDDGEEADTSLGFLKTLEEYELYLLEQDKENDIVDESNISDIERQVIDSGYEPMKNKFSCHNQDALYRKVCNECHHENRCIYHKKYKYDKVKFN